MEALEIVTVAAWCGTVGDEAAEAAAVAGDELVEGVDERLRPNDSKEPSQRAGKSYLREECHAAACVAWHERSVLEDEPPAVVPPFLGHVGEQLSSRVVGEREKSQLMPTIESRDDTRREPAEPSGA
jgi:hypothetical protein